MFEVRARVSANRISGIINAPSSKSYSQRYVILSGLTEGVKEIRGLSFSEDEQIAIGIVKKCGSDVKYFGRNITITPHFTCPKEVFVGESATSYRLAVGALAGKGCRTAFSGDTSLSVRPIDDLVSSLEHLSVKVSKKSDGFVEIDASEREAKQVEIDASLSSQFVSSVLLYYSFLDGGDRSLSIKGDRSSSDYIRITIDCLRKFGIEISEKKNEYLVKGALSKYDGKIKIEGDYSSSAFPIVLGLLASDEGISIHGLKESSIQGDRALVEILKKHSTGISTEKVDGDYIISAKRGVIERIDVDINDYPDLAPPLSVIGIFSDNGVNLRNYHRLAIKESNRADEIIRLAKNFGATVEADEKSISIRRGKVIKAPDKLEFYDHRMIMSAIIAGISSGFDISHENVEKINKSYPDFLNDISRVGASVKFDLE